jgi:hypothetical protein
MNALEDSLDPRTQETLEQVRQLAADVAALEQAGAGPLADNLARWLAAQYVVAIRASARDAGDAGLDLKALRAVCGDVVALRRGDHCAARPRLERERLELDRQQTNDRLQQLFRDWAAKPENKDLIRATSLTDQERAARIRQIFGLRPFPGPEPHQSLADPSSTPTKSDPIRPLSSQ